MTVDKETDNETGSETRSYKLNKTNSSSFRSLQNSHLLIGLLVWPSLPNLSMTMYSSWPCSPPSFSPRSSFQPLPLSKPQPNSQARTEQGVSTIPHPSQNPLCLISRTTTISIQNQAKNLIVTRRSSRVANFHREMV